MVTQTTNKGLKMWMNYETNEEIGKRINGISKKESIKASNAEGVVLHPKTGERIYWSGT